MAPSDSLGARATPPHGLPGPATLMQALALAFAFGILYVPTLQDLAAGGWTAEALGHSPIVFAVSLWLLWHRWPRELPAPTGGLSGWVGWPLVVLALLIYAVGRSQSILTMEIGSLVLLIAAVILVMRGSATLAVVAFPILFMAFMVPLPGGVVDAVTQPMKLAVSWVAETILYGVGYPIARTGVMLSIGPYQLLVADACAGLHTLFTLEALGLLYLNLVTTASWARNIGLALLIIPISFTANVVRVMALTLVTYHFGDAAGQGFLHDFAGMVLFLSGLVLTIACDSLLRKFFPVAAPATGGAA
ncbi:exosortase B [Roseateles sp. BYS87W]|uniref:Exosortase B n=1 Tax=Pelomonas baiyunensis TaxID=3299026 RepID=A0ABW7H3H0_9BURK